MALTRESIARTLGELRHRKPGLEWRMKSASGDGEYDFDLYMPGARAITVLLLEGSDSARVLIDAYTFDEIAEGQLQRFLGAALVNPVDDQRSPACGITESRYRLIVRDKDLEWSS